MSELLLQEKRNRVLILTLNRPEAMNCFNSALLESLGRALPGINADLETRVVILTGAAGAAKPAFCAGADLAERRTMPDAEVKRFIETISQTFTDLENLRMPTIAAVNGFAFGGGLELALACDLRVAAANAVMGLTETSLAVMPGAGGTQRLPRLVGIARAKEMIYAAQKISAREALEIGLVNAVAEPEKLLPDCLALAERIAENGPIGVEQAKHAINRGQELGYAAGLKLETRAYFHTLPTEDRQEGLKAFAEKRKPVYKGK